MGQLEREFADVIAVLDDGKVHEQLTKGLTEVVNAVMATAKAGVLTLKVTVSRDGRMVMLNGQVTTKVPQPSTGTTMFFATEDGRLRQDDPRQPILRNLEVRPTELRKVAPPVNNDQPKGE